MSRSKANDQSKEKTFAERLDAVSDELWALERALRQSGDKSLAANAKQARRELLLGGVRGTTQGDHNASGE